MRSNDMRRLQPAGTLLAALALAGLTASPGRTDPPGAVVAVLLDSSGSVPPRELDRARELVLEVLRSLPAGGEIAVFAFDDQSRLVLPRTSRADEVQRAVAGVRIRGKHTALHDALYDASRYLRDSEVARSAILLITDGKDEQSALNLDDGLRLAEGSRIPVFAVGVGQVEERGLRRIAKLTGGQYHPSRDASGAALVSAMMAAAPVDRPAAAAASPRAMTSPDASFASSTPGTRPVEARSGASRILWLLRIPAGLLLLAAIGVAILALRRAGPSSHPAKGAAVPELSQTVVSRMGSTEEYLEKTVVLRDKPVLAVTRGPLAGQVFDLSATSATSLGRAKANDVVLDDPSVSSQHCRIRPEEDGFTLLDLKSTNGTFVNERRVTAQKLAEGDVIKLGEMQLQFRMDQRRG